jgi:hypothetical protein
MKEKEQNKKIKEGRKKENKTKEDGTRNKARQTNQKKNAQ